MTMKQWTTLMDGIDKFRLETVPEPAVLKEDEVLVKIRCVSLNYRDAALINGDFKGSYETPRQPIVAASDASGVVVKLGGATAAARWREGDRVFTMLRPTHRTGPTRAEHHAAGIGIPQPGVLAECRVFPAAGLVAVPDYLTSDEASTLPTAATTAWMALNWDRPIGDPRRGRDVVVLLQGTGGVSIAGLQQAKALGLTTIVTSSSDAKLQRAQALGADYTINYKTTPNWDAEVLTLTNGKGADVVFETGGPATMDRSLRAVAEGGNISAIGILSGGLQDDGTTKPHQQSVSMGLIRRNATLKGINVGPHDRVEEMLRFVYGQAQIHPVIGRTFAFAEAKEALAYMHRGLHFGKVVINVD
ncbi:Alcohol dehydrogenase superfamily, zinc-type [Niveomyces insectorum RCEF 264]|uniref:Alcohol dehydrogenase superfamily, zinc-type n=1 Tax=Niveomyces insectorum RCEF 264 TaxID=1081102 RepID=A0A167VG08_9HYPO|nr:Alcohol dehydrogenase superfamily, zinc-type [Niveomyces insectorum RCEF 264]